MISGNQRAQDLLVSKELIWDRAQLQKQKDTIMKGMKQVRQRMSPPGAKKKEKLKYEAEPMVLLPSVPPESVTQYSINLPSTNKEGMLDEMDRLRNITEHLNEIVYTMEHVYVKEKEAEEEEENEEEETLPKDDYEDMSTFLMCCSQLRNQLETALREEKLILESLLQWFEKEVHEMEEVWVDDLASAAVSSKELRDRLKKLPLAVGRLSISSLDIVELGEEQLIPDWQIPLADKNITDNISKLMNRIQRLEELKGRVQELPKLIQLSTPKQEKRKPPSPLPPTQRDPKTIIEELVMKHGTEDVMNMAQVFQEDTGPQTVETMTNRMLEIVKVFERQTNKLHRVANEQDVLEGKLQKIQQEFRKLAEEKEIMEDELQKMKASETSAIPDSRKKVLSKLEKPKVDEKPQTAEKVQKGPSVSSKHKETEQLKMKEDLAKAQANVQALEKEKKMLEEMLRKALEEAEKAKVQLAEIPPNIPDWQFPYTAVGEDDKDLSKRSKKAAKSKGKGEDISQTSASETDRTPQRLQKADTGKAGEIFPGKSQDTSAESQAKDIKHKKKGTAYLDTEKGLSEGGPASESTLTDKKAEEPKKKTKAEGKSETTDTKGVAKSKESVETKKQRSVSKGAGKETYGSPVSVLSPLPPILEKQHLPDSTKDEEEILPSGESPKEILPPDSERRKTEITTSPQKDKDLSIAEQRPSPLLPESEVQDSLTLPSSEPEEIIEESKLRPLFVSGMTATPESTEITEGTTTFTPEEAQAAVGKEKTPMPFTTKDRKASAVERDLPKLHIDSVGLQEDEVKDAINKRMLQLADHLTELKGMPEAETVASLLLAPGKGMEELSDRQKLQLLNQLITPDELQEAQILVEGEVADKMKAEEREKKRTLLANVATTLQLLQQTQSSEAGQSEEEINEMEETRRILLANLESNLMELQQAQVPGPSQQDVDREINKLSEKRSQLLASLDLNMKNLQQAQALAATQPSEMSENKVKELLQQRELLVANLETNLQDLQSAKALEASLAEKDKNEKEINELSKKRSILLASLESNLKDLQEARTLEAIQPGSVTADKIKELTEQRKLLTADLETNLQALQRAQAYTSCLAEESRLPEMKLHVLSEKKRVLQEKLDSNLKDLQQVQMLASLEPDSVNAHKLQELTEQRRLLNAELDTTVHDMQEIKHRASGRGLLRPDERELYELSEKKQVLLKNLESSWKELQEAQALAATQPGSVSEHKLQELAEQRRRLTAELEATVQDICETERRASERTVTEEPAKRELYELFEKKQVLLNNLESNWKELQEAQALAATQPGSVSEHKLQELMEQRRQLNAEVAETVHNIQEIQRRASEGTIFVRPSVRELYELSEKKQLLLEDLESNWKKLQEVQALAATQPGSISERELQELAEQRQHLTADLEATIHNIQKVQRRASKSPVILRPAERELYELSERKQLLLENLESNWKELQEAQALVATQPGSISEHKLKELAKQRKRLTMDLEATVEDMQKAQHRDLEKPVVVRPIVKELYELSEKKQLLLGSLESNERELQEAQALAATQPGSISEHRLQVLAEQRRRLTAELEATVNNIQRAQGRVSESTLIVHPAERDLYELSEKKQQLLERLKELQEAQAVAATQAGNISEDKLQVLAQQRRRLTAELEATVRGIQQAQNRSRTISITATPSERELYELSEKKQFLLEMLESNRKELQAAQSLAAIQPGSISESKLQQLAEQRKHLSLDLEVTEHKIQEIQRRASEKALIERSERKLCDLSVKKQLLLENVESNLKDLQDSYAIGATQPSSINDKIMQVLNEQTKLLSSNLAVVVQDTEEIKAHISQLGGIKRPIERDVNQLFQKKKMFLEYLETNLKDLQEAHILFATHPSNINEQKIQELTEQRRLLTTALEAIVQDIEDVQGLAPDKSQIIKSEERVLGELSNKKKLILKNLASNLKDLKQAQALAAAHPGGIADDKVKELTERRKLLAASLEAVEQDMQKTQGPVSEKVGIFKPSEKELDEVSEKRMLLLEKIELNMKELKDLHVLLATQPDNISEEKMQELSEKRMLLAANLEAFFQDIQEMESTNLEQLEMTKPDMRKINDLILLSRLESKLNELQHIGVLSDSQLDRMKRKVRKLKKQKRGLIDRWEIPLQEELLTAAKLEEYGLNQKEIKELLGRKRSLFSYVRSSIRDLQQKGIIQQGSLTDKEIYDLSEDRRSLEEYLVAVPVELLESERAAISAKYEMDAKQTAKQKALAAKLEANIKDLQAALETEQIKISRSGQRDHMEIPITQKVIEPLYQQPLKPITSGLQLQITRVPEIKRVRPEHISFTRRHADVETDMSPILAQQDKILKKEIELTLKRQLLQQIPSGKPSLPVAPSPASLEASVHKVPDNILQQMIDYRRGLIPGHNANLHQALLFAKYQLHQANILAAAKERDIFSAEPSALGTARFHEYTMHPTRPVWEGNQLPQKDYAHKLNILRKKFILPEMKGLSGGPSVPIQGPNTQDKETGPILICGKGCNVYRSKHELFPVISKQPLRHD